MFLQKIINTINNQEKYATHLPHNDELINILRKLPIVEQKFISNYVITKSQSDWHIGTANIFSIMQQANILYFADFIYTLDDFEYTQLIMNNILESNYILLANLIQHIGYNNEISIKITNVLDTSIRQLIDDILTNNDIKINLLHELKEFLNENSLENLRQIHFDILLKNNDDNATTTITDALQSQNQWNKNFPKSSAVKSLIKEIMGTSQLKYLQKLFEYSTMAKFSGWKFYLYFLRFIVVKKSSSLLIRKFFRDTLQQFFEHHCDSYLFIVLVTARQLSKYNENEFYSYSLWYKQQFSDIRYRISINDFKYLITVLKKIIKYENDIELLTVHANTYISPPLQCNDIILMYKQMCRNKLNRLVNSDGNNDSFESITEIDD